MVDAGEIRISYRAVPRMPRCPQRGPRRVAVDRVRPRLVTLPTASHPPTAPRSTHRPTPHHTTLHAASAPARARCTACCRACCPAPPPHGPVCTPSPHGTPGHGSKPSPMRSPPATSRNTLLAMLRLWRQPRYAPRPRATHAPLPGPSPPHPSRGRAPGHARLPALRPLALERRQPVGHHPCLLHPRIHQPDRPRRPRLRLPRRRRVRAQRRVARRAPDVDVALRRRLHRHRVGDGVDLPPQLALRDAQARVRQGARARAWGRRRGPGGADCGMRGTLSLPTPRKAGARRRRPRCPSNRPDPPGPLGAQNDPFTPPSPRPRPPPPRCPTPSPPPAPPAACRPSPAAAW